MTKNRTSSIGSLSSPLSSPSMSSPSRADATSTYCDRHIPSRLLSNLEEAFDMMGNNDVQTALSSRNDVAHENQGTMNSLIRAELLGQPLVSHKLELDTVFTMATSPETPISRASSSSRGSNNVLRYKSSGSQNSSLSPINDASSQPFAKSSGASNRVSLSPRKALRKISRTPYKVLDAPSLQDDYYLNLVDWSSSNILSVALGSTVYLWSACTSKVTKLCELPADDAVTSISWALTGNQISVGTTSGQVQIWDATKCQKIRDLAKHTSRVGSLAWNSTLLASGSRDRSIALHDIRVRGSGSSNDRSPAVVQQLSAHKQEICGLKWSFDERMLASGGNDNKLYVWSPQNTDSTNPLCRFDDHTAAVKAVAWSPHQHGLLASGGGTADRHIRFWNCLTGSAMHRMDTGSQVCNLMWSKNVNEIVSTHGYSLNQIIVWKYPSMQKITTLTGHTLRVLYLAMSPDGQSVVTGAGDETLRFWNIFPGPRTSIGQRGGSSLIVPSTSDIR